MKEPLIVSREIPWQYRSSEKGRPTEVPIITFNNMGVVQAQRDIRSSELPIVFLTGYGQDRRIGKVISWLGRQRIYTEGVVLPFDRLPATRHAVETVSREGLHIVTDASKELVGVPLGTSSRVMGYSQGGGIIFESLKLRHEGIGDIAAIAPVGFQSGQSLQERSEAELRHEFVRRFVSEGRKQPPLEIEKWVSAGGVLRQIVFDLGTRRWKPKVGYAVTQESQLQAVKHAAQGKRVGIILGKRDGVFPPGEISGVLESVPGYQDENLRIIVMPGVHHTAPNTQIGRRQLIEGVRFLEEAA